MLSKLVPLSIVEGCDGRATTRALEGDQAQIQTQSQDDTVLRPGNWTIGSVLEPRIPENISTHKGKALHILSKGRKFNGLIAPANTFRAYSYKKISLPVPSPPPLHLHNHRIPRATNRMRQPKRERHHARRLLGLHRSLHNVGVGTQEECDVACTHVGREVMRRDEGADG